MMKSSGMAAMLAAAVFFAADAIAAGGAFTCDFRGAGTVEAEPPAVRRASMPFPADALPPALSVGDTLTLALFDDIVLSLRIVASPPAGIAGRSFIAAVDGSSASAIVKLSAGEMRATVDDFERRRIFVVRVKDGVATVTERDNSLSPPDGCATCRAAGDDADGSAAGGPASAVPREAVALKSAMTPAASAADASFDFSGCRSVVDILVVFDSGARAWVEGSGWDGGDDIGQFAGYAVDKMNDVLERSRLLDRFCYRLVGVAEIGAVHAKVDGTVLAALRAGEGAFAPVAAKRKECGADVVALLVDRTSGNTSGIGYELAANVGSIESFGAKEFTCCVCDIKTVHSRYTLSHEVGHVMGCGHSDRQGAKSGPGRFKYSCGYHFPDAAGTRRYTVMGYAYTDPPSGEYLPIPYFSSPDIAPDEYGVAVGTATNDNRRTLLNTSGGACAWRKNTVPYEWELRFTDDGGNYIADDRVDFLGTTYVTLTNDNPDAQIYYTTDGSMPGPGSFSCRNGQRFSLIETTILTACSVVDGSVEFVRTVLFKEGEVWSGEPGKDGSGAWTDDPSVLAWDGGEHAYDRLASSLEFPDLAQNSSPTVSVHGTIHAYGAGFTAASTAYTFVKGAGDAMLHLPDAVFAPAGDLTFNLPVQIDAAAFTNPANHTLAFNAPFGQTASESYGCCTSMIGIGANGTLAVSPGAGGVQEFDFFNNTGWFYNNATIRIGSGTVVFRGPVNSRGLFGSTKLSIAKEGCVVLDVGNAAYDPFYTSVVSGEGTVVYKGLLPFKASHWTGASWTGTVVLTNISAATLALDAYGWEHSTVRLTGVSGYPGAGGNTNIVFGTAVELVDGADGTPAWTVGNGYSSNCASISRLKGGGTLKTTRSPGNTYITQGFAVADASDFTGSLDLKGTQFTFGRTVRKNSGPQAGAVYIDAGCSVTNAAAARWSAANLVVNGELVKRGALSFPASVTFGDGASFVVDSRPQDGVVLTSASIVTNGAVSVAVLGDDNPYVAEIVDGGGVKSLVMRLAPLPETVPAPVVLRCYDEDTGWTDREFAVTLPSAWATNHYPSLDTAGAVAAKYGETAANGAAVWQCYMLGLDPTDAESRVSLSMTLEGGELHFAVEGLGETHAVDGIGVWWYLKSSEDISAGDGFRNTRESAFGLSPAFSARSMPDTPADLPGAARVDRLFYRLSVSFVAE